MPRGGTTPVNDLRTLRRELRTAREESKLTQKEVADALDWSSSKVIRIENGDVGISVTDLKALLLHYGITEAAKVDRLVSMARSSRMKSWWDDYRAYSGDKFITFLGLENSAIRIRQFQGFLFPGLLQTESYAQVLTAINADSEKARKHLEIRMRRQELLEPGGPELFFIIDESVLHRTIGDTATMRGQLERIKEVSSRQNVTVQLIPFSVGVHQGMKGSFEIFELSEAPGDYALLLDQPYRDVLHEDPSEETQEYVNIFYALEKIALSPEESIRMLDRHLLRLAKED